jgi:hypothetical protein
VRGWLDVEPLDVGAYIVSDLIGMIIFFWLRQDLQVAILVSIFVSFHLFLAWLVITADHEIGFSLPVMTTIFTHLACMVVVYLCSALVQALSIAGAFLPIYIYLFLRPIRSVVAVCIPGVAIFERYWLFSGGKKKKKEVPLTGAAAAIAAETAAAADEATAEDYEAWLKHLSTRHPSTVKRGLTVKQEYEQFVLARAKARAAKASAPASGVTGFESRTS